MKWINFTKLYLPLIWIAPGQSKRDNINHCQMKYWPLAQMAGFKLHYHSKLGQVKGIRLSVGMPRPVNLCLILKTYFLISKKPTKLALKHVFLLPKHWNQRLEKQKSWYDIDYYVFIWLNGPYQISPDCYYSVSNFKIGLRKWQLGLLLA